MTATCFSRLFTAALLLSAPFLSAQVPTIQDCLGAIPVCQEVYTESQSPTGDGCTVTFSSIEYAPRLLGDLRSGE